MKARFYLSLLIILMITMTATFPSLGQVNTINQFPQSTVTTASSPSESKISSSLLQKIRSAAPGEEFRFIAHITAGSDLSMYVERWFARPFIDPLGTTVAIGIANSTQLMKMAGDPNVTLLQGDEMQAQVPEPDDQHLAQLQASKLTPAINQDPNASPGPAPTGWYNTTAAVHGSTKAWEKGYTGTGVRFMSNDSGADYCHPDLFGTYAYIDDPTSPYYGLPEMFDSLSSYATALYYYLGDPSVLESIGDYAITTNTSSADFAFTPRGAAQAHTYHITGTSLSGIYHFGSHPDNSLASVADILSSNIGDGTAVSGERAGILVVDEHKAGVYDTVYVDVNYNYDFSDDNPARLTRDFTYQETACLDYDSDGLNDVSGGLVYFISDGSTAVPTLDWYWGIPGSTFGNGDLVAFHIQDFVEGSSHGQGTTSVATGQGVVRGSIYWGPDGPPVAEGKGLVVGPGKDVKTTQNGDVYASPFWEDGFIFAGLGYDAIPGTGDDIQIVSDSWAFSSTDNDGFDYYSRLISTINRELAPYTTILFAAGNGASGYGTSCPPKPVGSIGVGASTVFDSIGVFDPILSASQIVSGDIISWSNRGPGARNVVGTDVVATGAFGTGDVSLNQVLWGAIATADFGGTSMATPVAGGNLALMVQAWKDRTGQWPTFEETKALLMSSAKNLKYDTWSQGAGMVNADEGTNIAGGLSGMYATPTEWAAGDYRGIEYPGFSNIIHPGQTDTQVFTLQNTGSKALVAKLSTQTWRQITAKDYSFTTQNYTADYGNFTMPDYVFRIDQQIPRSTDLLMARTSTPYAQFDPSGNFDPLSMWSVALYDWTDLNGDGNYWEDYNGNGKVDPGEMDEYEYIRYNYGSNVGPTNQARVANPLERMHSGILLGLTHDYSTSFVPTTNLTVEVSSWKWSPADFLTTMSKQIRVPAHGSAAFPARIKIPSNASLGMYEAEILVDYGASKVVIPVTAAVAASGTAFNFGNSNPSMKPSPLYANDRLFGYTDLYWRAESGDWRFFWTDIQAGDLPTQGTPFLVVDNRWAGEKTDIDTIVLGPTFDDFSPSPIFGPYTLAPVAKSPNTNIWGGAWLYQTSSGGPREIIAAPAREGLHGILLHQVRVDGKLLDENFKAQTGLVTLDPAILSASGQPGVTTANLSLASQLNLDGFTAEGFGLGSPVTSVETILQDDPGDYSTASFVTQVTIQHGGKLNVSTCCSGKGSDIDLYVVAPDGSLAGTSLTASDTEFVSILFPQDGTYTIYIHGYNVPGGSDTFELTINAIEGYDISIVSTPANIPAGTEGVINIAVDTTGFAPGKYYGLIMLGPAAAPGMLQVPVDITVEP
jgi:hypothetical protein